MSWVVLIHRMPRQPSTPRIAVWRRLKALGVAKLADGVVALPEDARSREHLEWIADQVEEARGAALLLRAQTLTARDERTLARTMTEARAEEYRRLAAQAQDAAAATPAERSRRLRSLRRELRIVQRRDYFPPAERDRAKAAIEELAALVSETEPTTGGTR